jgi:8-oxo-dGTP diphosphatase
VLKKLNLDIRMKKIEVVAAIIVFEDEILCVQRPPNKLEYISHKFEFPGGKIEDKETNEEALCRELKEELNINPRIDDLFLTVIHPYPDFELIMHSYLCQADTKTITLNEHISSQWLQKEELLTLDWAAADLPIVHRLLENG